LKLPALRWMMVSMSPGDFTPEEYLGMQRAVHRVAEAVREEVGAERMYIFSFGSNQGNALVHWCVVPLPPGTPYEEQQFAALVLERRAL
jgi:diadenosine tetraphosphate (Ap4A) HIT family hydrolase